MLCTMQKSLSLSLSKDMHPHLFPLVIFLIIFSIQFHKISCSDDEQYKACNTTYKCGDITIPYPFWGASARPDYCGYPGFQLNCDESSSLLTINISTLIFRVLNVSLSAPAITVARQDYWDSYCPSSTLLNTTIDFELFNYASNSQNMSLYYDCPSAATGINFTNKYMCDSIVGYYMTRELSAGELAIANSLGSCNYSVKLPVFETGIESLIAEPSLDNLIQTIDGGFGIEWVAENDLCNTCGLSGGECGRNVSLGEFVCYCVDGPRASTCENATSGKKSNKASLIIGLIIAAAAIGGISISILFFVRRKQRMKKLESQSISKDLTAAPSSSGIFTPSTNFSRTTPSYFSSESTDLEKGSMYYGVQLFSYNELEEATNNFDPSKELGEGGFGIVYYGKLHDGRVVAVKRLFENSLKRVEQFINEVEILAGLRHPNLVSLYGCTSKQSPKLLLVYEYIPNGTVADHLHGLNSKNSSLLTWPVRLSIAIETAGALAYLHKSDIIHRDVKTNNILLDNAFRVKVADFGLSRLFPTDVTHVSTAPQGTPGYVDPEYYLCYQLTDKSDVYSFGVVLVELITSLPAVDTNRHRHDINLSNMAITKIQNHTLHELIDPCIGFETDDGIRRMVTLVAELAFRCLQHDRDMRPSMEEVLEHLRVIQKGDFVEVVDISFLPESDKWANSSAATNSF